MLIIYKRVRQVITFSLLALAATSPMVLAQGLGNSPYSSLGIGELYSPAHVTNMGMGDVGVSNASAFYLNLQNPALLARRSRFTVFEVGLVGQSKGISQYISNAEQTQTNVAGNLSYVALAFPANSRWNIALSLKPYSYVNYNISQLTNVPATIFTGLYSYTGRGGLNKASISNGVHIGKSLYAGLEASFLFGNITESANSRLYTGGSSDLLVNRLDRVNYKDIVFKAGIAWRPKLNDTWTMNIGATYEPQMLLSALQTNINQQTSTTGLAISAPDTIRLNSSGKATLPQQARFGISIEKGSTLLVGVDVSYQQWSHFRNADNQLAGLKDVMTLGVGGEFTPKPASNRYRDLITYRAGFQFNQTPYTASGGQVNDVNGSIGISLPIGSYLVNHATISLVGGQRGVINGSQIRERYVRIGVGFSLNDWWFRKTVID